MKNLYQYVKRFIIKSPFSKNVKVALSNNININNRTRGN